MERNEIIKRYSKLYCAVVCDILDQLGYRSQWMNHQLRPIDRDMAVVGFAYTFQVEEKEHYPEKPYGKLFEGIESLQSGDIVVAAQAGLHSAFWGELCSERARIRGCRGAVVEGMVRDMRQMISMQFPVFCIGATPTDMNGRSEVVSHGTDIICGGVRVQPGDLMVGDMDGLVVVPRSKITEVLRMAEEKALTENKVKQELEQGMDVMQVYEKYGVL